MVGCAGGSQVAGGSLQLWIVSSLGSLPRVLAPPGDGKASWVRSGWTITPLPSPLLPFYRAPVSLVMTCVQCREQGAGGRPDRCRRKGNGMGCEVNRSIGPYARLFGC